ncbi:MAG TPA: prepilin-type N-terminal cleavage/methylation domain-containing protein [Sumerlaeia bacterium]|nr:prepilin-type N-terminal cleavage/methylation domain-containing protein [Sumerlaeia bacterium]
MPRRTGDARDLGGAAFTLIELLIVVAIIAILAAIAVPNFLEAQIRSKVSRAHTDFRSMATALESFRVDHNNYPPFISWGANYIMDIEDPLWSLGSIPAGYPKATLTTPVAYIATPISDPFLPHGKYIDSAGNWNVPLQYGTDREAKVAWVLESVGPDGDPNPNAQGLSLDRPYAGGDDAASFMILLETVGMMETKRLFEVGQGTAGYPGAYDASNGTKSNGDIVRMSY